MDLPDPYFIKFISVDKHWSTESGTILAHDPIAWMESETICGSESSA